MLTTTLIYVLEALTAVMVLLLTVQVARCYRAESMQRESVQRGVRNRLRDGFHDHLAGERNALSAERRAAAPVPEIPPVLDTRVESAPLVGSEISTATANSTPKSESPSPSSAILNDYIGEFFAAEPAGTQAPSAFTAPATESVVAATSTATGSETQAKFESTLPLPIVEELEEDIIMVAAEQDAVYVEDKVMSDKVVHAMLDEAKLVCAS